MLEVLDSKPVVPADPEVEREAGTISGKRFVSGQPIGREDCVVAATALAEDEPVVARSADHFERIPGLEVVTD